jgi:hypothetical protein
MLVSSNMPGYAITSKTPATGTVIGKALEDKNDNDIGMIYLSVIRG